MMDFSSYERLGFERRGRELRITIENGRLNAVDFPMHEELARVFYEVQQDAESDLIVLTEAGRAFCAGEDMKEALEKGIVGSPDPDLEDPFMKGTLEKPVIAAVNGFAMGGGFMMVERTDLRVAVPDAVFEMSEAKRWLLGGYNHGHVASLPHPVATEMALGFRFNAKRLYEVGFINRLAEPADLIPTAMEMAEHMLTLPPAARVNTIYMLRQLRPQVAPDLAALADALHEHGDKSDRVESRAAFAEKRKPNWKGWLKPEDRYNMPTIESVRASMDADD